MWYNPLQLLQSFWFTDPEAQAFLACVKLGSAPASTIARHADLERLSAHNALSKLYTKWYVSSHESRGSVRYTAIWIDVLQARLTHDLAIKLENIAQLETSIHDSIDFSKSSHPEVTLYTGHEGMKSAYEQSLIDTDYIFAFIWPDKKKDDAFLEYLYGAYIPRRNASISDIKTIMTTEPYERYRGMYDKYWWDWKDDRVLHILPEQMPLVGGMIIYGNDRVITTSYQFQGMNAVRHINSAFHDSMKALFLYVRNQHWWRL